MAMVQASAKFVDGKITNIPHSSATCRGTQSDEERLISTPQDCYFKGHT
jgi:hypothetical protein